MTNRSTEGPDSVPDAAGNICWFCTSSNASYNLACSSCRAQTTPKRKDDKKLVYHKLSFGQRADTIRGCERLHASLLDVVVYQFQQRRLCAVQVGLDPGTRRSVTNMLQS